LFYDKQHSYCIPHDEVNDVRGNDTNNENLYGESNNMKHFRDDIVTLKWNA